MGVHGLWNLLAPVGRRVSVETLAGKRLAIDASIWMIQFLKAMRDEKGEMVRYAHLLGFFRRICKLLYLRTKPIFVFDGGTPALKRRTVIARRRQRENAQAKIRKTAEKLLLNQLKQIRLKELANELDKQRKDNAAKHETVTTSEELEKQNGVDDPKGKKVISDDGESGDKKVGGSQFYTDRCNQEAIDEMLAASLLAEEDEDFNAGVSSSDLHAQAEGEDADEDEEIILPTMPGKIDPAILASLPPSVQLDLLVQMRERLMAENRQKYQKVKKAPARFSELQIQAYLKTVAFRREIDEVQKSAAGRGIGGVQTSRIASEANREFIFSSSFSGDKQMLTSVGEGRVMGNANLSTGTSSSVTGDVTTMRNSIAESGSADNEPQMDLDNGIETYLDERGRRRVSRVRAMGIRMTRDLQRNLDFMKEFEKEQGIASENASNLSTVGGSEVEAVAHTQNGVQLFRESDSNADGIACVNNKDEETALSTGCAIEISFENNGNHEDAVDDDDLFSRLVAGDPVMDFSVSNSPSKKPCSDSVSEFECEEGGDTLGNDIKVDSNQPAADGGMDEDNELEWEDGGGLSIDVKVDKLPVPDSVINHEVELDRDKGGTSGNDIKVDSKLLASDGGMIDESGIEWKVGYSDIQEDASLHPAECRKTSRGDLEEEADLQEAIRQSLLNLDDQSSLSALREHKKSAEMSISRVQPFHEEDLNKLEISLDDKLEDQNPVPDHGNKIESAVECNKSETNNLLSPPLVNRDEMEVVSEKTCQRYPSDGPLGRDASEKRNSMQEVLIESIAGVQEKDASQMLEQIMCTSGCGNDATHGHSSETTVLKIPSGWDSIKGTDTAGEVADEEARDYLPMEYVEPFHNSASLDGKKQIEITEANLEEEILVLGEEEQELGDVRRKLERNAESVSSEMFAECQELLQIFGLPFIIAPMEAEAQCAYMELNNLVDGVVTDDSDAFLFGARSVYKNIFDDRKYVETYFMKDIENELGLNRDKLISMALLLGSDYTEGVSGIGIVNAIEVVNAFPEEDGLHKFREWIESPDPSILGKSEAGINSRKRESKVGNTDTTSFSDGKAVDDIQKIKQIFMDKHRNVSKNWHIPSSFPSDAVTSAYTSPQVDKSKEPFSWGKPDHFMLRKLCWEKFGWSTQKADELLLPVLKEYNKRETQLRLEAFYTFNERFAKIRSKRIKKALKGMAQNKSTELMDEPGQGSKKRDVNQGDDAIGDGSGKVLEGRGFEDAQNEANGTERSTEKNSGKKRPQRESKHVVGSRKRPSIQAKSHQVQNEKLIHKGRGRGNVRTESIEERMKKSSLSYADSCSNNGNDPYNENDSQVKFEGQCQVRRSGRPRKKVDYAMCDSIDDGSDQDDGNSQNKKSESRASSADFVDAGNGVMSPSKINTSEIVDQVSPRRGYQEGDWVSAEKVAPETRVLQSCSSKNDDILAVAQSSNDYLTMGGGFCLDEDDASMNLGGLASPTRATTSDSDLPNQSSNNPTERMDIGQQVESRGRLDTCHVKQNAEGSTDINRASRDDDAAVNKPVRSLRAMPNLRKRGRKS